MKKKTWYRLDNAAKIYPPITNSRRANVFALSAVLTEKIDKETLNDAINVVLNRFPSIKVKLKRGIFWYYFEENKKPFYAKEEKPYFLEYINERENNDYLFKVLYRENKITLVIFHALCDGMGGLEVLKALIFEYLILKGNKIKACGELKTIYSPITNDELQDNFLKVFNKNAVKPQKETTAFKISETPFSNFGTGIIVAKMSLESLKKLAKEHNATITSFVAGLTMFYIYSNFIKNKNVKNKNIKILIPVNMRKFYKTQTVRNFALFTRPSYNFNKPLTLIECIEECTKQIKSGSEKNVLDTLIASHVKAEKNFALKIAPLFIKDLAMQLAYKFVGDNLHTTTISNLGNVTLPESVTKLVKEFIFTLGTSYTSKHAIAMGSYNGIMNITFSREFVETSLERDIINYLTQNGVNVEVLSNYWEDNQ